MATTYVSAKVDNCRGLALMAMVRARPPKPRCRAAACWEGVTVPVVTLIQACASRANLRKCT
eukprot:3394773-Pyramimonas_sp.AAC.1